ncbi:cytochrome-c peroxidase [Bradyrhizobium sp.]|uniref:cytochrome-c peroxidase n=1 Tax=Bradyrhizobium sp. TaxID=376 RepID=UPI0040378AF5
MMNGTESLTGRATKWAMAVAVAGIVGTWATDGHSQAPPAAPGSYPDLAPLPRLKINEKMAELGRYFFFDVRLSGDAALSCASCHDPKKGWADGAPLSKGYPASEYFRNSPTLINAGHRKRFMWDGRLDGSDMGTLVRDMITEAHTMNMDARLMQERLKQVPEYVAMWDTAVKKNDDINGMRVFNVVGEFVKTIQSKNVPFDRYLAGDTAAISAEAEQGLQLFKGRAGCIQCHNGSTFSDGNVHRTGVPENPNVWNTPERAITMLRHYATSGMPNYMNARTDVGAYAITKDKRDVGKFLTPSLRELKYTAPYMHNGMYATLNDVIDFYDKGGGEGSELKPLNLSSSERSALVAFLQSLSGDPVTTEPPKLPGYKVRVFGTN